MTTDGGAAPKEPWAKTLLSPVEAAHAKYLEGHPRRRACVDAAELLRQVCLRTRATAGEKNVPIIVHCTCGPVWVQAETFSEAIFRLLENAITATRPGYPVYIDVRQSAAGEMLWQIQDTGKGMAMDAIARLGEPRSAGSGVGVANAIIQRHGGVLRFESAPGVGTTVTLWLPASEL
jgi:two-component system, OmpR family, sensor histidine kinase BaeS